MGHLRRDRRRLRAAPAARLTAAGGSLPRSRLAAAAELTGRCGPLLPEPGADGSTHAVRTADVAPAALAVWSAVLHACGLAAEGDVRLTAGGPGVLLRGAEAHVREHPGGAPAAVELSAPRGAWTLLDHLVATLPAA
ncbi:hypothetical protein [Marinitenerispora sediminis]|uniref:Uncharacterized protein n=1 Tax=Marinitenerispora sediminis TaxID=1931232 RepID=A0A368TC09_9ACTN|nr:hypothetical protein [Marinitenerispora sediminis]RCV50094.1 hypothetical protein DEF28_19025 [Marinitenerispora sediminis]RCV54463.1 hypothetical protein DEF23_15835 [Marinitenerispora sediminis]RCV62480.1 hypothetical protein DEF24_00910 [Marinitenerispora sediminis]